MGLSMDNDAFDSSPMVYRKSRGSVTLTSINVAGLHENRKEQEESTAGKSVGSNGKKDEEEEDLDLVKQPGFPTRTVILEPSFALIFMFHIGSFSLTGQYMLYAFGEKYNLSAVLAAENAAANVTSDSNSRCISDSNAGSNATLGYDLQQKAQAENAMFNIYMDLVSDIPGFFFLLVFGKIMDRLGRKPCMLIPLIGIIFRASVYILQMTLKLPIEVILITGFTDAITGGFGTFLSAGYAFFADTIPADRRGRRMTINDVFYGFASAAMSFAMGYMIEGWGFTWPLVLCLGGHFINLAYIIFFVPESRRRTADWSDISPRYIVDSFKVIPRKRPNKGRRFLLIFSAAWITYMFSKSARGIDNLYHLNDPFCWTPVMMGTYSMVRSMTMNLVQIAASIFLFKRLGDVGMLIMGSISGISDELLTGLAALFTPLQWAVPITGSLSGIQSPVLRSQMSKLVEPGERGAIFASLGAITALTGIAGSAMYNTIYAETLYFYKGTVFFVIGAFVTLQLIILIIFKVLYDKNERNIETKLVEVSKEDEFIEKF